MSFDLAQFCDRYPLRGAISLSTTRGAHGLVIKDTSSSGTPTTACTADGFKITLASTAEAEIVTLYTADLLLYKIGKIDRIIFEDVQVADIDSVTTLVVGLASAQNDTADSVTANAWFRIQGSASTTALLLESDDNVTDVDDVASGLSLGTTPMTLIIDFTTEVKTIGAPGVSKGQQATFWGVDPTGSRRRLGVNKQFDLSGYAATSGLQPFVQLQKGSGTGTPSVTLGDIHVFGRR